MQCSKEALVSFFYNVSSSSFLLLILLYFSLSSLAKFFHFIGSYPLLQRSQDEYEYDFSSEDEEEEKENEEEGYFYTNCVAKDYLVKVDDIVHFDYDRDFGHFSYDREGQDVSYTSDEPQFSARDSPISQSDDDEEDDAIEQKISDAKDIDDQVQKSGPLTHKSGLVQNDESSDENLTNKKKPEINFSEDENFLSFAPARLEHKKVTVKDKEDLDEGVIFGDSFTVGSTSKSSSEWRSSINCRDSGTEDPFSSSSRRSCPKWESYTLFQKYDEEMMFLDRISAQKLHETESLRSIQACPKSISERFVQKITTMNKKPPTDIRRHNPYHELEAAYVAQICLTWEALHWNYKNFEHKRELRRDFDHGCPATIAQQFQQFQVLLQRYVENEPYEHGRRPEIYARMRLLAPRLLLVPEYRDSEDDQKDEDDGFGSRISSASFVMIMEECLKTFMDFLKADKEKPCQILKSFFGRARKVSVDPTLLQLIKKVNTKKKMKLKDLRRGGKCIRRRKLKVEEEMEILMGLIDLKVVSRVLRTNDISEEQLHWCEEKMSKVRIMDGKLQRDSSTLFFPAH